MSFLTINDKRNIFITSKKTVVEYLKTYDLLQTKADHDQFILPKQVFSPVLFWHHGSYNYGLQTQNSDYDVHCLLVNLNKKLHPSLLVQVPNNLQIELGDTGHVLALQLQNFYQNLMLCNLNTLEVFFAEKYGQTAFVELFSRDNGWAWIMTHLQNFIYENIKYIETYKKVIFIKCPSTNEHFDVANYRTKQFSHLYRLACVFEKLVTTIEQWLADGDDQKLMQTNLLYLAPEQAKTCKHYKTTFLPLETVYILAEQWLSAGLASLARLQELLPTIEAKNTFQEQVTLGLTKLLVNPPNMHDLAYQVFLNRDIMTAPHWLQIHLKNTIASLNTTPWLLVGYYGSQFYNLNGINSDLDLKAIIASDVNRRTIIGQTHLCSLSWYKKMTDNINQAQFEFQTNNADFYDELYEIVNDDQFITNGPVMLNLPAISYEAYLAKHLEAKWTANLMELDTKPNRALTIDYLWAMRSLLRLNKVTCDTINPTILELFENYNLQPQGQKLMPSWFKTLFRNTKDNQNWFVDQAYLQKLTEESQSAIKYTKKTIQH